MPKLALPNLSLCVRLLLVMSWQVEYTSKARKQLRKLPVLIADAILALAMDIEESGPIRGDWPNFSKLSRT